MTVTVSDPEQASRAGACGRPSAGRRRGASSIARPITRPARRGRRARTSHNAQRLTARWRLGGPVGSLAPRWPGARLRRQRRQLIHGTPIVGSRRSGLAEPSMRGRARCSGTIVGRSTRVHVEGRVEDERDVARAPHAGSAGSHSETTSRAQSSAAPECNATSSSSVKRCPMRRLSSSTIASTSAQSCRWRTGSCCSASRRFAPSAHC